MNLVVIEEKKSFKAVSNAVWVCLKAVIVEKTIKEERTTKKLLQQ